MLHNSTHEYCLTPSFKVSFCPFPLNFVSMHISTLLVGGFYCFDLYIEEMLSMSIVLATICRYIAKCSFNGGPDKHAFSSLSPVLKLANSLRTGLLFLPFYY